MKIQSKNITRLSGVKSLGKLKRFYKISNFRIGGTYTLGDESRYALGGENGVTLESLNAGPLRTACILVGTPELDDKGQIVNAVIISPYYSGDSAWCYHYWHEGQGGNDFSLGPVVGPGRLIDTNKYYVIFLDALGLWGASKPSDGLGLQFPQYSIFDCVQANYRMLKDELNVGRIRLATGVSMGAIQSYVWALLHPDYVDAIMPIGGSVSTKNDPMIHWLFDLMSAAIKSDPVWRSTNGDYYHLPKDQHPNKGVMFGWSILMHCGLDPDFRIEQGWKEVRKEVFYWEPKGEQGLLLRQKAREYDANDLLKRNFSQDLFDIRDEVSRINCPALVIHVENDLWLRAKLAREAASLMPNARFASFENPLAHYAVFRAPNILKNEITSFFKQADLICL